MIDEWSGAVCGLLESVGRCLYQAWIERDDRINREGKRAGEKRQRVYIPGWCRITLMGLTSQPAGEDLPRGIIPLVEYQRSSLDFIEAVRPARAMIRIDQVNRMLGAGITAASGFPRATTTITTSTIPDRALRLTPWKTELERLKEFEPDYHIPADTSVYKELPAKKQADLVIDHLRGYTKLSELIETEAASFTRDPPMTIPLIKTTDEGLLYHTFEIMEAQGDTMAAFYATQYYTGKKGRWQDLIQDVKTIFRFAPEWFELLIIGCLGSHVLRQLPSGVVAASGLNRWREEVHPTTQSDAEMRERYMALGSEVQAALGVSSEILHTPVSVSL